MDEPAAGDRMEGALDHPDYEILQFLGEGTAGIVHKAKRKSDGKMVAIKQIRRTVYKHGVNGSGLREVKVLRELHHPNIVQLVDIQGGGDGELHLVLEFCEADLDKMIRSDKVALHAAHIKAFMSMLLKSLEHIHARWILHRDLKPENILYGQEHQLKLTDFGLGRHYGSERQMTNNILTIWYRSPEILFGAREYETGVDMWAAGCVFGEMFIKQPMFKGENELDQLGKIFTATGTPKIGDWANVDTLDRYVEFNAAPKIPWSQWMTAVPADALDLLDKLLDLNPATRWTATQALAHPYFSNAPKASAASELPDPP
jgi:cyclin-dependent kinase 7